MFFRVFEAPGTKNAIQARFRGGCAGFSECLGLAAFGVQGLGLATAPEKRGRHGARKLNPNRGPSKSVFSGFLV